MEREIIRLTLHDSVNNPHIFAGEQFLQLAGALGFYVGDLLVEQLVVGRPFHGAEDADALGEVADRPCG